MSRVPLSILDLATVGDGESVADALHHSVEMAQLAERHGYKRVWYAEHHNMRTIASSATSVLIAHIAANTNTIRLGSGGIMLPNHAPITIAEQFGTLETLHPGRIDLGLGRAPGTDQRTVRALRRSLDAAETFPSDVRELQAFLSDDSEIPGVTATPGRGTNVPVYILGSSLFGAELAAAYGLPYAFASHFAPHALLDAIVAYRDGFKPSEQLQEPYVIAGVNAIAADTQEEADDLHHEALRSRLRLLLKRRFTDEEADMMLRSPQGHQITQMAMYSAVGTAQVATNYLDEFAARTGADELIVAHHAVSPAARLRSVELLAQTYGLG